MAIDSDPLIDWERRADGKTHRLIPGVHFDRAPKLVRKAAGMWALRHGHRCLSEIDDTGAVLIRLVPKGERV